MKKSILILILISISISSTQADPPLTKITKEENKQRLNTCGQLGRIDNSGKWCPALEAPWLVKIDLKNGESTTGILISPRHILTDRMVLKDYTKFDTIRRGLCKDEHVELKKNGIKGKERLKVDIESIESENCKKIKRLDRKVVNEVMFGRCDDTTHRHMVILEINKPVTNPAICLPDRGLQDKDFVNAFTYDGGSNPDTTKPCVLTARCTNNETAKEDGSTMLLTIRDHRETLAGLRMHSPQFDSLNPYLEVIGIYQDLICQFTGVCALPKITTAAPPTTTVPETSSKSLQTLPTSSRPSVTTESPKPYTGTFQPHPDWHMNRAPRKRIEFKYHLPLDPIPSEFDYEQEKLLEEEYDALDGIKKKKKKKAAGNRNFVGILVVLLVFWELFE